MYYITSTPNSSGAYPAPQSNPAPGLIPLTEEQAATLTEYNGFVTITETEEGVTVVPNTEAWEIWKANVAPDPEVELAEEKSARIQQSKDDLEAYLAAHPLTWTDGQQYSITREKQQQLTSKILSATLAAQTSTPYNLTWNATGKECTTWTLENLSALAFAIDSRVTALVSYQQAQEVAIRDVITMDGLNAIEVDYDTVQ